MTEEYNGTSWSTATALINGKRWREGLGSANAGLVTGGYPSVGCTEHYDGSSW